MALPMRRIHEGRNCPIQTIKPTRKNQMKEKLIDLQTLIPISLAASGVFLLSACQEETTADKIEDAVEEAGDAVEDAAEEIKDN
jgi:hypothetical protein